MSESNIIYLFSGFCLGNIFYYCCLTEDDEDIQIETDNIENSNIEVNNNIVRTEAYIIDNRQVIDLDQN